VHLTTEWFGVFLTDKGRTVKSVTFPKSAEDIASRLLEMEDGHVLPEERELGEGLGDLQVIEARLLSLPGATLSKSGPSHRAEAAHLGFGQDIFHEASIILARRKTRRALAGRDKHVVQAVTTLDELANIANLAAERLREWYGIHAPELVERVERHEELATLISTLGNREKIGAKEARYAVPESMGADLGEREESVLRTYAKLLSSVYSTRAEIEKYLDDSVPVIAPNVSALVGPSIAARLLKQAGGLDTLARLPSGTIQTLGAEKALFRHLKEGAPPPKHGAIYQHPLIYKSSKYARGRIARTLSAKLALAARADAHTRQDLSKELVSTFERKALALRERYSGPPKPRTGTRQMQTGRQRPRR
jgi:nucleolar protein 56